MKKMSEVFELPINHEYLEVYGPERAGIPYAEAEKHAAHAINHADALAEALERLTKTEVINPQYLGQLGVDAINNAKAALAAYRSKA